MKEYLEGYEKLSIVNQSLLELRDLIENRFDPLVLQKMANECARGRRVSDQRFGNVREQFARIETEIKLAKKSCNTLGLHTAITRVGGALRIHKSFIDSSNLSE